MPVIDEFDSKKFRDFTRAALRQFSVAIKVLIVTLGSIAAVIFASLIISIIQFQSRLSEARTQNGNITLESIQLIADYQDEVARHYKLVRDYTDKLNALRTDYTVQLNSTMQLVNVVCTALEPDKINDCYQRWQALIFNNSVPVDASMLDFGSSTTDKKNPNPVSLYVDSLKQILETGTLKNAGSKYFSAQSLIQSECTTLTQFTSAQIADVSLLGVSRELKMSIEVECNVGANGDRPQAQAAAFQTPSGADTPPGDDKQAKPNSNDISGVNRILLSELVFYYRFYSWLTSPEGNLRKIILSPPEFIVIMLVIATGILGSFLFHSYSMFKAKNSSEFPTFISISLRATLSVMCALVIYILSRTGFVAITDGGQRSIESTISPFVIAFISVAAGLLAEKAMERIQSAGDIALNPKLHDQPQASTEQQTDRGAASGV